MNSTTNKVYATLLYWTKINLLLISNNNKVKSAKKLEKIEEYLSTLKISEVASLHTSKEYYTISYKESDKNKIFQFTIDEINSEIELPTELNIGIKRTKRL